MITQRKSRFGFLMLLSVAMACGAGRSPAAEAPPPVPAAGKTEETNSQDMLRAYLQVQEQLHETRLAIERNRVEAEEGAARAAEGLNGRLKAIEQSLASQRNGELQAMQSSNRLMLILAGMFAAIALVAMLLMAFFQWRTVNRLAEISAAATTGGFAFGPGRALAALGPGEAHAVTVPPAEKSSGAERAGAGLLNAVERLEQRVHELEHTAHPPLNEAKGDSNPAANDATAELPVDELKANAGADESKADPAKSNGEAESGTSSSANEIMKNGPGKAGAAGNDAHTTDSASPEAGRITGLLGKGQSLLNVDKAEEALACFEEILTLDARNAEALVKKGTALERLRMLDEAIECYDRAIAADSSMTIAYLYKGGLFNRLERFTEAMECYEQALRTQEQRKA